MRAVVFDFDGLILDTEVPVFVAWQEAFAAHGTELTFEEWSETIGTVGWDPMVVLEERIGRAAEPHLLEARRARRDELTFANSVLPGVEAWLHEARELGLAVGIASSSPHEWVSGHLQRLGLVDHFACLSCMHDAVQAKPAPDLYLAACRALDVLPAEALAVEDSPNGVTAAKAAGMRCVAVPNELTRRMGLDHADVVLESLASRRLVDVLKAFD